MEELSEARVLATREIARGLLHAIETLQDADEPELMAHLQAALAEAKRLLGVPEDQCILAALRACETWVL